MYKLGLELRKNVVDFSASVDALTVRAESEKTLKAAWLYLEVMMQRAKDLGIRVRPATVHGYKGARVGSVQWGERDDKLLVMVTGKFAEEAIVMVDPLITEVTRIDTQITVNFAQPNLNVVRAMQKWLESDASGKRGKAPWKVINSLTGDTLYLGNRESERFFRVYDKGGQQGSEKGLSWRYEMEAKGSAAQRDYLYISETPDIEGAVVGLVYTKFGERLVRVPVLPGDRPSAIELPKKERSREDFIAWLQNSVKPVVLHLQSLGERDRIVEALGIQLELFQNPEE